MFSEMQAVLFNALTETENVRSFEDNKENLDCFLNYYSEWKMSIREVKLYNRLGVFLSKLVDKLHILDVGCGPGMTPCQMFAEVLNDVNYSSIDKAVFPEKIINPHVEHNHYTLDILTDALPDAISNTLFDVVIIDIEPHGKEREVYEKIRHLMKPTHLCILKHVAFIDCFGAYHADMFIDKYKEDVFDYFAEYSSNAFACVRDVFVIISKDKVNGSEMKCQSLAQGEVSSYENTINAYCKFHYHAYIPSSNKLRSI